MGDCVKSVRPHTTINTRAATFAHTLRYRSFQVMASVSSVTLMCHLAPWCASVMSATMVPMLADVSFVAARVSVMPTTAQSVQSVRKMYVEVLCSTRLSTCCCCYTDNACTHNNNPTQQRDGCPKIVNLGSSKTDLFYERKKYGFKKR